MKTHTFARSVLATLVAGCFLPLTAYAGDAELLQKIEALTQQLELLKAQVQANQETQQKATAVVTEVKEKVQKNEEQSTEKWLTIGGDYQFRVDSLSGEAQSFTDVNRAFSDLLGSALDKEQIQPGTFASTMGSLAAMNRAMSKFSTYEAANNAAPQFRAQMGAAMAQLGNPTAGQVPAYKPKNETLYTNRFGLDLNAKATQDVSVSARLLMYKTFGANDDDAITNSGAAPFFADRVGVFDGTLGHIPSSSLLNVDRVYATWSNIAEQDIWFSVGRRPSTHGASSNLRNNTPRPGTGGTPSLLVDYAFDGMTVGWAPDIDGLPGAYGKLCYGRGFEAGFSQSLGNAIKDTDMVGISLVPIDTDALRVWTQWNRGMNIFDAPKMSTTYFGDTLPSTNLGDVDWLGLGAMGTIKRLGHGDLNWFADAGLSITHPNNHVSSQFGFQGLLTGGFLNPEAPTDKTGSAIHMGLRYDLPSKTKIGLEFNHGSKNWITFAPASGDAWTSKVGTRGNVYEAYLIQELDGKPISSRLAKSFFRIGFQVYDFQYTGSNNWVGAPVKISTISTSNMLTTTPLSKAYNAYATFEVKF